MTERQEALAIFLLSKLKNCWNDDGELVDEYCKNIRLPELSKTALKNFKAINSMTASHEVLIHFGGEK